MARAASPQTDVLRFFGKKVNQSGEIPAWFHGELKTDLKGYREGERVQYSMDGNQAKFYRQSLQPVWQRLAGCGDDDP